MLPTEHVRYLINIIVGYLIINIIANIKFGRINARSFTTLAHSNKIDVKCKIFAMLLVLCIINLKISILQEKNQLLSHLIDHLKEDMVSSVAMEMMVSW